MFRFTREKPALSLGLLLLSFSASSNPIVGDFNGDGFDDILVRPNDVGADVHLYLTEYDSNGVGFPADEPIVWDSSSGGAMWPQSSADAVVGDFNLDGYDDIFLKPLSEDEHAEIILFEGEATFSVVLAEAFEAEWHESQVLRLTEGAGAKHKLLVVQSDGNYLVAELSSGELRIHSEFTSPMPGGRSASDYKFYSGDFNGDGSSELLGITGEKTFVPIGVGDINIIIPVNAQPSVGIFEVSSSGIELRSTVDSKHLGVDWLAVQKISIADTNSDGAEDLLVVDEALGVVDVVDGSGGLGGILRTVEIDHLGLDFSNVSRSGKFNYADGEYIAAVDSGGNVTLVAQNAETSLVIDRIVEKQSNSADSEIDANASDIDGDGINNDIDPDDDGDSMPDAWENANSLDPADPADSNEDPDSDGYSNAEEFVNGTDPNSADNETYQTNPDVGELGGSFNVSSMGAAEYTVPVKVPPGSGGMMPQVSLTYSSRAGNGLLGVGWSLNAGEGISRCSATYAQDGFADAVDYDNNDRLCLNGMRLVPVDGNNENYGEIGTEYRTETETFAKIIQYGGALNSGNAWFKVWTKSGLTKYFGDSENSNIRLSAANDNRTTRWAISKVEDPRSNYMLYDYEHDLSTGETVLSAIRYTGNNNAGLEPYASVNFIYTQDRTDVYDRYVRGSHYVHSRRLDRVESSSQGVTGFSYQLSYQYSASTHKSRLGSITECGVEFRGATSCNKPLTFTWKDAEQDGFSYERHALDGPNGKHLFAENGDRRAVLVDLDGDGEIEWVESYAQDGGAALSGEFTKNVSYLNDEKNGWTGSTTVDGLPGLFAEGKTLARLTDLDADGVLEFLAGNVFYDAERSCTQFYNFYCDGEHGRRFMGSSSNPNYHSPGGYCSVGGYSGTVTRTNGAQVCEHDVRGIVKSHKKRNGEGYDELYDAGERHFTVNSFILDGDKIEKVLRTSEYHDFNGDGLPDLLSFQVSSSGGYSGSGMLYVNNGTACSEDMSCVLDGESQRLPSGITANAVIVDINGDGSPDAVMAEEGTENATYLNSNLSFDLEAEYSLPGKLTSSAGGTIATLSDINSDGLPDYIVGTSVYLNTGAGFSEQPVSSYRLPKSVTQGGQLVAQFQDVNGDGFADYVWKDFAYLNSSLTGCSETGCKWTFSQYRTYGYNINYPEKPLGVFVDINQDGFVDYVHSTENHRVAPAVYINKAETPDLLIGVTRGFGAELEFEYKALTDEGIYNKVPDGQPLATYPYRNYCSPRHQVVSKHKWDTGRNTGSGIVLYDTEYEYEGALVNLQGRGLLGFSKIIKTIADQALETETVRYQRYPLTGRIKSQTSYVSEFGYRGALIKEERFEYSAQAWEQGAHQQILPNEIGQMQPSVPGRRVHVYPSTTITTNHETDTIDDGSYFGIPNNFPISTVEAAAFSDQFGNITSQTVKTYEGAYQAAAANAFVTTTTNTFDIHEQEWWINELKQSTMVRQRPGAAAATDVTSYIWTPDRQLDTTTIGERLAKQEYDQFGNIERSWIGGSSSQTRLVASTQYENLGRFPVSVSNALGHTATSSAYHPILGLPETVTDANNTQVFNIYDGFGRMLKSSSSNGSWSRTHYFQCEGATGAAEQMCKYKFPYPVQVVSVESSNGSAAFSGTDRRGNVVIQGQKDFSGDWQLSLSDYDELGREIYSSVPFWGCTNDCQVPGQREGSGRREGYWEYVTTVYDPRGRVKSKSGIARQNSFFATNNGDEDPWELRYQYNGLETVELKVHSGAEKVISKNVLGEIQTIQDDATTITHAHDARGNLTRVINGQGDISSMSYDQFGNKETMSDPDMGDWEYQYNVFGELISQIDAKGQALTYKYDVLGRVAQKTTADGTSNWLYDTKRLGALSRVSQPNYSEEYEYDSFGRITSTTSVVDEDKLYGYQFRYDSRNRVAEVDYPGGLTVLNEYNLNGHLSRVSTDEAGGKNYWELDSVETTNSDDYSRVKFGNGLYGHSFVDGGSRRITREILSTEADVAHGDTSPHIYNKLYAWDAGGNRGSVDLVERIDPGFGSRQRYNQLGNLLRSISGTQEKTYQYGENGAGPHAVTSAFVDGQLAQEYTYDANGNMVQDWDRSITWNASNKPIALDTENGSSVFKYGPNQSRYSHLQVLFHQDGTVTTDKTYYVGGLFEAHSGSDGDYALNYIKANGETVAIVKQTSSGNESSYTHRDYQGSVVAITDDNGDLVESVTYEAFGKRTSTNPSGSASVGRGYTGHQHLDHVNAIHMNGRIYDPELGRMLSADPTIPDPMNTQAYNRYSYVLNNPYRYTDPSGFSFFDSIRNEARRFGRRVGRELERGGQGVRDYFEDELFERETWENVCSSGCYAGYETNGEEGNYSGEIGVGGGSARGSIGVGRTSGGGQTPTYSIYAEDSANGNRLELSRNGSRYVLSLNDYELYAGVRGMPSVGADESSAKDLLKDELPTPGEIVRDGFKDHRDVYFKPQRGDAHRGACVNNARIRECLLRLDEYENMAQLNVDVGKLPRTQMVFEFVREFGKSSACKRFNVCDLTYYDDLDIEPPNIWPPPLTDYIPPVLVPILEDADILRD